ncbi:hypothetical protein V2J09_022273 [Rumex salicifolius]
MAGEPQGILENQRKEEPMTMVEEQPLVMYATQSAQGDPKSLSVEEKNQALVVIGDQPSNDPGVVTKSWKDMVMGIFNQQKTILDGEFLKGRISVPFLDGNDGNPAVEIAPEVIEALSSVWQKSVVVIILGHLIALHIVERKLREMWRSDSQMQVLDLTFECFLVRFGAEEHYLNALSNSPWMMFGRCIVVRS